MILKLSQVARDLTYRTGVPPFGGDKLYNVETARMMADAVLAATIPVALVLWGTALFWFIIAGAVISDMAL